MTPKQPDSEWRDDFDVIFGTDKEFALGDNSVERVKVFIEETLHQREQQLKDDFKKTLNSGKKMYEIGKQDAKDEIYAELMEKIEPPKEWRHCLKVAFGQEETCALCGFCPEKLKTIINNIFKHE